MLVFPIIMCVYVLKQSMGCVCIDGQASFAIQEDLQNIVIFLQGKGIIFLLATTVLHVPVNSRPCPLELRGEAASYSDYMLLSEKHPVQQNPNSY